MIKAVVFDLDGTLLNRDASLKLFINSQYERLKPQLDFIPKLQYMERFIELDARGMVWKDRVYQQLVKEFQLQDITWEELLADYLNVFKQHCVPFPHLKSMLEELKDKPMHMGIISNGRGQFQLDAIQALGIEHYFDVILISEWQGMKKPDPRLFMKALAELGTKPEETLYVGDHPDNDVLAAKSVGMKTIWKKDPQWSGAAADYIIEELNEIMGIVNKQNIVIRKFRDADVKEIVSLFYETVHEVNAADYSEEQLAAWAPIGERMEKEAVWGESLRRNITYVADIDGTIAGFCDMATTGYLNRLYVHKNHQRQGIASKLVDSLEQEAGKLELQAIRTEASLTAKPFFEERGYQVIKKQSVERKGIAMPNYKMLKKLSSH
ncbi:GNAT family N-acetyltransferase [Planococcus shenhongbingii]